MGKKTVVINIVGLSKSVIGKFTPFIQSFMQQHAQATVQPVFPAVTTTAQSVYLTGKYPVEHGIVGNGWFDRKENEVKFWKQSNGLVEAEKIWERAKAKDPSFTCASMFWWYNMYLTADYSVTPRPQYHSDGVKAPDCYAYPAELRDELQSELGTFPLFNFWGPNANIVSSKWIADASLYVDRKYDPTLTLIYLPHLDYCLQKFGPDFTKIGKELGEIDDLVKELVTYYQSKDAHVILLSEYGINPVSRPVHVNRILRKEDYIRVRVENGLELLDAGASPAFAVADHQIAHIYIKDKTRKEDLKRLFLATPGVARVLDEAEKEAQGLNHERAGDLVLMAESDAWFTYYYWEDDALAPDFARSVDIHKKPGYDPAEMFMDPHNPWVKLRAGYKLLRKKLGFRYRMDVIGLDATVVKGSHGAIHAGEKFHPVFFSTVPFSEQTLKPTQVYDKIWEAVFGEEE
jgi:predicted AlkP superfamily pyrophosphatase or phosphodiesterase